MPSVVFPFVPVKPKFLEDKLLRGKMTEVLTQALFFQTERRFIYLIFCVFLSSCGNNCGGLETLKFGRRGGNMWVFFSTFGLNGYKQLTSKTTKVLPALAEVLEPPLEFPVPPSFITETNYYRKPRQNPRRKLPKFTSSPM